MSEMTAHYQILRLSQSDVRLARQLHQLLADVFENPESYTAHPPSDEYVVRFLADDRHIVLVAVDGEQVIGGLFAYVLEKFEQQRREVYLYDLAVRVDQQRKGVGRALVTRLQHVATEAGAYLMFVQADEEDDAVYFYESLNPSERVRVRSYDFPAL